LDGWFCCLVGWFCWLVGCFVGYFVGCFVGLLLLVGCWLVAVWFCWLVLLIAYCFSLSEMELLACFVKLFRLTTSNTIHEMDIRPRLL
jgi:hypothetical protein